MFNFSKSNSDYTDDPDVQLMLKVKDGDARAFDQLMENNYKPVLNFIYRYVGSAEIAEDLTQDVFLNIYNAREKYAPKAKFQTFAFQIARNLSLNELRKHKRVMISMDASMDGKESGMQRQLEDVNSPAPDAQIQQDELQQQVKEAIDALPENQRAAVILRRYHGMSYEDIAQSMQTTEKAVKSLLSRAKENLKILLKNVV